MRIPLTWLRTYVDIPVDAETLAHDLTMSGTKIEAVHRAAPEFTGVQVGKVLERSQHPNADRLSVCEVDVGGERLHIVCGAPNVREGLTVAVARVGARLAGNVKIRRSKIRGEVSEGMICSARELGLGDEHDGILELDEGLRSGEDFAPHAGAGEVVLEAEITPNRPDCLSMLGIAREVAALYGVELRLPPTWTDEPGTGGDFRIEIESAQDCRRYLGRRLRGLRVEASPAWLQQRLRSMGLEPINNIVDITNFVLFETGQPLHAFDATRLEGGVVAVRRARAGERLRTLDGEERELDADVLVIADANRPVAIAGVMGGADSAVVSETTDVLLEVAWFAPEVVRRGRRKLGLDTDASYRFERGTDAEAVRWVADRATRLLMDLAGATSVVEDQDAYPAPPERHEIALRLQRVHRLVGTRLPGDTVAGLLRRLQLPARVDGDRVVVSVPSFRRDLEAEIDLVEEVARMHGYDNIPSDHMPAAPLQPVPNRRDRTLKRLIDAMVALGYFELRASAFMDRRDPDRLQLADDDPRRKFVAVRNPLVSSFDTMRTSLWPAALRILAHNQNHGHEAVRVVQVDRVFRNVPGDLPGLPTEEERLVALAWGLADPPHWSGAGRGVDLFDVKGDLEALLAELGVDTVWSYGYTEPFFEESVSASIKGTYGRIGGLGAVRHEVLDAYAVAGPVYGFEIDVAALERHLPEQRRFEPLPRFPAVKRDLSLVVPAAVAYAQVREVVERAGGPYLDHVDCFDVFEAPRPGAGARSLGIRLRFRSRERTLTDADVDPSIEAIVRELAASLEVQLRAAT